MKVTLCDHCSREIKKTLGSTNRFYFNTSGRMKPIDLCPECLEEFKLMLGMGKPKAEIVPEKEPENDN